MHLEVLKHYDMLTVTIVTMLKTSNKARCVPFRMSCKNDQIIAERMLIEVEVT